MSEIENIIQELSVPLKTFRIFAIEKAIRAGSSPELLQALKTCLKTETDGECKILLEHAIASIEERLDCTSRKDERIDYEKVLQSFALIKPSQQMHFIKSLPRQFLNEKESGSRIDRILKAASHPVVIAELINKCRNYWPVDQLEFLEKNLFSSSLVLQLACVEAIIQCSPEVLQRNFEKLVLAPDPVLRALAIRGLARSFPESAAEFLTECLRKGDHYGRLAALRVCSVMPYDLIKNSLLELLYAEKDPKLLKIAAAIIMSNPDKEVPFRLCEMIPKIAQAHRKFLQDLIKSCCEIIKISEICDDFSQYLASVQKYHQSVRARFLILNMIDSFVQADTAGKAEIRQAFREKVKQAEIAEVVADLKKSQAALIAEILGVTDEAGADSAEGKVAPTRPVQAESAQEAEMPADQTTELLHALRHIEGSDSKLVSQKIERAFSLQNNELVILALKAAMEIEDHRWVNKARSLIRSSNEALVSAAFDYLAKFDSDHFLLILRGFINTPSIIVRATLLRNVCRLSPEMGRELLGAMLKDPQSQIRQRAVGSIIHFEFASIREILFEYLSSETNEELISSCLSFYYANPVLESVFDLKQLEQRREFSQLFADAGEMLIKTLEELNIANPEEVHHYIQERQNKDNASSTQPVSQKQQKQKLESIKKRVVWSAKSEDSELLPRIVAGFKIAVPMLLVVLAIFWYLNLDSGSQTTRRKALNTIPVAGRVQDYILVVQTIDSVDGALIGLTSDKKFVRAVPRPGKMFMVQPGDKIRLKALPFKIAPDDTLIVKTISIRKQL